MSTSFPAHSGNRHPAVRLLGALLVSILVFATGSGTAFAQSAGAQMRTLDTRDPANIVADILVPGGADLSNVKVDVNGTEVPVKSAAPLNIVDDNAAVAIVLGSGPAMAADDALTSARTALKAMVDKAPAGVQFSVTSAGSRAARLQDFSSDKTAVKEAIDEIGPSNDQKTALFDAIRIAASPFQTDHDIQPNLVIVTGDSDNVALTPDSAVAARGSVLGSGTTVFAANLATFDPTPIDRLVADAGGVSRTAPDGPALAAAIGELAINLFDQQYRVQFDSGLQKDQVGDFTVTMGDQTARGSVRLGGFARGLSQIQPKDLGTGGGIPFLDGPIGLVLVIVATLIGVTLLTYAMTLMFVQEDNLSSVLQPYADGSFTGEEDDEGSNLGRSAIIQRAVDYTEQVASNQGYLTRTENVLEQANLPLRAGEALFAYLVVVIAAMLIGLLMYRNLIAGIIFGVLGAVIPPMLVTFLGKRRRKKFMMQLPDTLQLLSGTLRAGYSLMQGIEAVSQEVQDPMGIELRRVVTESRLGRPVEEALDSSAERMASPDFAWAVMAIRIQREVGGNLSELLLTVAETMTARERLRRDVAALTAEGRMSAIVLGLLPPGLGLVMFAMNPNYTGVLLEDGLGIGMLIAGAISMLIGFAWMRKIINIEI